jgi:glycosyltransferase involved in cell wall biosynthesis
VRIVSIITSLTSGGAEMLVAGLSAEFSVQGHGSTVVTLCDAATLGNPAETEAMLRERIESTGGRVISLGLGRRRSPMQGWLALRRVLQKVRPDAIHAHTARALAMLGLPKRNRRVFLTHHNSRFNFHPLLLRTVDWQVDGYVAISAEIREVLTGLTRKPIASIANAPAPRFRVDTARTAPRQQSAIISVGAISEQKNYALVIDVAQALEALGMAGQLPVFRIAGTGPDLERLRHEVRARNLARRIEFLGERRDVPELLAASDLYLNTSCYEGMPIALLEAMAMALPIVATDVAGNRELVETGKTGLLAPLGDPAAIAAAIARLLTAPGLYGALSAGALEAARGYAMERVAQRHLALYAGHEI